MFLPGDSYSEAIVHFIGHFAIQLEDHRARLDYDAFNYWSGGPADPGDLLNIATPVHSAPDHTVYQADVALQRSPAHPADFEAQPMQIRLPHLQPMSVSGGDLPQNQQPQLGRVADWPDPLIEPGPAIGPGVGSVALLVNQYRQLIDDDFVSTGEQAPDIELPIHHQPATEALTIQALAISAPFSDLGPHTSATNVAASIQTAMGVSADIPDSPDDAEEGEIFVTHTPAGIHIDGALVDEAPSLMDALPSSVRERLGGDEKTELGADADEPQDEVQIEAPVIDLPGAGAGEAAPEETAGELGQPGVPESATLTINPEDMVTSMTVDAGGNLSINEASVMNAGISPVVLAVAGDVYQLDAIVQVNAYSDIDSIADDLPGAIGDLGGPTKAFNIAQVEHIELDAARDAAATNPDAFASNWQISFVEGDLVFMDWISQYSFTSDNDVHVLTATGTTTTITSGENLGLNTVSFANLGHVFDLVMVAGNFYDSNFILQTNVLQDNDRVEALGDLPGAGDADISTGSNLLWNQAGIINVGAAAWDTLGASFRETFDALGSGRRDMPDVLGTEDALAGLGNLKMLYVSGSIYDLHYISQVNVVGDSDFVALFEEKTVEELDGKPGSEWHISTGSNALINAAVIVDYDTVGHSAFAGGSVYSDAILIQAEIVESAGQVSGFGDDLATELLAFLDDTAGDSLSDYSDDAGGGGASDAPSYDVIGSMLT